MQKRILHFTSKIEVRKSPIEGWGVFAKEDIFKGETLEESPFIIFPQWVLASKPIFEIIKYHNLINPREKYISALAKNLGFKDPEDYYFKWRPKYQPDNEDIIYTVLPLGFGPIYNTSNSGNNAEWKIENDVFVFVASQNIKKDEEICTFYGYFLDEEGVKFECDDVYNLGLDYLNGIVSFKSIRFGNLNSHQESLRNIFFVQLTELLRNTASPVLIKKLCALSFDGKQEAEINIPKNVSLKNLFNKLKECKDSSFPKIKFIFQYINKETKTEKEQEIIWER
jgi:hypothetical protein